MLRIERAHLAEAVAANLIAREQADRLWSFLEERCLAGPAQGRSQERGPRFTFTNVLYYLGGMLAIGAMSLFMTLGWEQFGGAGVLFMAVVYIGVALVLADRFEAQGLTIPTGILATLVVVLVPLAMWGLQHALGLWPAGDSFQGYRDYHYRIDWRWISLELTTLAAGALMLRRYQAPFLLMPLSVTLWYMSMDLAMVFTLSDAEPWSPVGWEIRRWFSIGFGLVMLLVAFAVDLRSRFTRDYAFWLYLFGLLTFWAALSSMHSDLLEGKLVYLAINVALVLIGAVLVRRSFTVFGAIGIALVLGDISYRYFKESFLFPIALTGIGLATIYLGIWWSRNEARLAEGLQAMLPQELRELLASRRQTLGD